jgi:hypothetical protein
VSIDNDARLGQDFGASCKIVDLDRPITVGAPKGFEAGKSANTQDFLH